MKTLKFMSAALACQFPKADHTFPAQLEHSE